jgi:hypothetical protein
LSLADHLLAPSKPRFSAAGALIDRLSITAVLAYGSRRFSGEATLPRRVDNALSIGGAPRFSGPAGN